MNPVLSWEIVVFRWDGWFLKRRIGLGPWEIVKDMALPPNSTEKA